MENNGSSYFNSPSLGKMTFEEVISGLASFVKKEPDRAYKLIVGTDSSGRVSHQADFVTAVIIHRVGQGAIYFWQTKAVAAKMSLKDRIYQEAFFSLETAQNFLTRLGKENGLISSLEIHVDVGQLGPTRDIIHEVVGMIRGNGFAVKVKPDSYGASKVADRHT